MTRCTQYSTALFAKLELFGVGKLDHLSLLDFCHVTQKCETSATEQRTLAADQHVLRYANSPLVHIIFIGYCRTSISLSSAKPREGGEPKDI
jgi:hypothetical protein